MEQSLDDLLAKFGPTEQLTGTLKRALDQARAQGHQTMTLEHLLWSLCEDPDSSVVMRACSIDLDRLKSDMSSYLQRTSGRPQQVAGAPAADDDLVRILRVAHAAAQQRQRAPNGGLVLAAIVGDGRSPAANMLRSQGLTFEAAVKALQTATVKAASPQPAPVPEPQAAPEPVVKPEEIEEPVTAPPSARPSPSRPVEPSPPAPSAPEHVPAAQAPNAPEPVAPSSNGPSPDAAEAPARQPASMRDILDDARRRLDASKPQRRPVSGPTGAGAAPATPEPLARLNRPISPRPSEEAAPPSQSLGSAPAQSPSVSSPTLVERVRGAETSETGGGKPANVQPGAQPAARADQADRIKDAGIAPLDELPPVKQPPRPERPAPAKPTVGAVNGAAGAPLPPTAPVTGAPPPVPRTRPPTAPQQPQRPSAQNPTAQPPAAKPMTQPSSPPSRTPTAAPPQPQVQPARQAPPQPQTQPAQPQRQLVPTPPELKPPVQHASPSLPGGSEISRAVPKTLHRARTEIIEVRISRSDIDAIVAGPVEPTTGRPVVRRGHVVSRAMTLRMRSGKEAFHIEPTAPETQWVEQRQGLLIDDSVLWRWAVTPRRKGGGELQVLGSVRTVYSDGQAIDTALPTEKISVRVKGKPGAFLASLGGFTLAAGIGAAVAVAVPIVWPMIAPLLGL